MTFAPAKLNLYLHVTGKRDDGFHLLDSLVAFADIGDEIGVEPAAELRLAVDGPFAADLTGDPRGNLVWRAAATLAERLGRRPDIAIRLTKNLPVASGIGGGSSDAAACLRALAERWRCDDRAMLNAVAASLGSDVPACLAALPAWLGGIGDRIDNAGDLPRCGVLLANPRIALPTASVYRAFKGPFSPASRFPIAGDAVSFARNLVERNSDLTGTAIGLVPEIGVVLKRLARIENNLLSRMSGSGATCFALFGTNAEAAAAANELRQEYPDWWIEAAELSSERGPNA
ncbi:MAG: 4-(cytidine 5'-diphospho)-2-C-methyl-D-erythritol kinase [Stellaceae bacterium]